MYESRKNDFRSSSGKFLRAEVCRLESFYILGLSGKLSIIRHPPRSKITKIIKHHPQRPKNGRKTEVAKIADPQRKG